MIGESWSPVEDERLRALWDEGLSTGAIGREMRRSKNAVVGRAGRIGLSRPSPIRAPVAGREVVWTAARNALLREGWPAGTPAADLLAAVNGLPGRPVANAHAVVTQARYLRLPHRRVAWSAWTPARDALLAERWPRGWSAEALLVAASALPGEAIGSAAAVATRVKHLGLQRDADALSATLRAARWPRTPSLAQVVAAPVVPIRLATGGGHGCQFVTDDTPYAQRFCEAPRAAGSSYCPAHHAICHSGRFVAATWPWRAAR